MSVRKTSVKVTIVDEEYSLRSDASPERTEAVARYVDEAIRTVLAQLAGSGGPRAGNSAPLEVQKAAILAALQITNDLFDAREQGDGLSDSMRALSADLRRMIPPAKRGEQRA